MDSTKTNHQLYKYVADPKSAPSHAWAFLGKDEPLSFFPYETPILPDDEVRLKVTYAGLCFSDVHWCRGHWGNHPYPVAPGHEIAGVVTEIGKNVTRFKVGDKICIGAQRQCCKTCKICKMGEESYCGNINVYEKLTYGKYFGGYSTHSTVPENFGFHIPEGIPENVVAPLLCAGITVWAPISKYAKQGMKTAVAGIGGLGHLAVQFLAKMGLDVTAITTSLTKKDYILSIGATRVINSNSEEDLKTWAGQFDLIVNCNSSSGDYGKLLDLIATFGTVAQCGLPDQNDKMYFTNSLVPKGVKVVGVALGSPKEIEEMLEFAAKNQVFPKCEEFSFEDFPKAFEHLEHGRPNFRCVVNVKDYSEKHGLFK